MSEENQNNQKIDPIKEQIAGILQDTRGVGKDVKQFISTNGVKAIETIQVQAPEICKEIIYVNVAKNLCGPAIWFGVFIVLLCLKKKFFKYLEENMCSFDEAVIKSIYYFFGFFAIPTLSIYSAFDAFYIIIAPKLFLIEYFVNLFK